jgi:hypothetical protein
MASNKKPSIYSDRGSIGSSEELDEYGVWIKSEPQVLSADNEDTSIEDSDLSFDEPVTVQNSEFEDIEFPDEDLNIDDDSSAETDMEDFNIADSDIADSGIGEINNIGSGINLDDSFDNLSISDEFASDDFGVPTVKSIENNINSIQDDFTSAVKGKEGDLSTQLLLKIANELSSIRTELQDLKKEFSIVRAPAREDDDETIALTGDELDNIISDTDEPETSEAGGGFFTEEDDDTIALTGDELNNFISTSEETPPADDEDEAIALTGDELDNILNSADFTEESGVNETPEDDFSDDFSSADFSMEEESTTDDDLKLDDDLLADSLTSDDLSDTDLGLPEVSDDDAVGIVADDAFPEVDFGMSEETPSIDIENDELIDIDDLNINLDEPLAEEEVSIDVPAEIPAEEDVPTEEAALPADDDIDIELGSDIDFDDDNFADITDDSAELSLPEEEPALVEPALAEEQETLPEDEPISMDDFLSMDTTIPEDDALPVEDDSLSMGDISLEDDAFSMEDDSTPVEDDSLSLGDDALSMEDDSLSLGDDALTAEDDSLSLGDVSLEDDALSMGDDSLSMEDDLSLDAELTDDDLEIEFDEDKDADELKKLRDEGAKPVTFAPDNSSYLESEEDLNPDSFDLSDAVIDEPEMFSTDHINDNLVEPSLENEFDMDALDDLTIDEPKAPEEDDILAEPLTEDDLDIPADDNFAVDDFNDSFDTDTFDIKEPEPAPKAAAPKATPAPQAAAPAPQPATPAPQPAAPAPQPAPPPSSAAPAIKAEEAPKIPPGMRPNGKGGFELPSELKSELRNILSYMDQLLESLPEEKIEEFAKSEYFDSYKKLFKDLGLV